MNRTVEICCGSYYDAKQAALGGAERIELNCALHLGGLTPTLSTLKLVKQETDLKVITMIRPRGAGFCYNDDDFKVMLTECETLMANGADGAAFGCLNADATLDNQKNKQLIEIIKKHGKEAVFHRAFDCVNDPYKAIETLIELGVDRLLTSGLQPKAMNGADLIKELQEKYGDRIEILAGSGVNASNAKELMDMTGINQIHSSCKDWLMDATTKTNQVSYCYAEVPNEECYDVVSQDLVKTLLQTIGD